MPSRKVLLALLLARRRKKRNNKTRSYIRPLNSLRNVRGEYAILVNDLRSMDEERHFQFFRMSKERYNDLLRRLKEKLTFGKNHRYPISADERLVLTLRYLAHGDAQQNLAITGRYGKSTVNQIIYHTCRAIWDTLSSEFLSFPDKQKWKEIANDFWKYWNYPHCLGAIDGKHIAIKAPANAGSDYYNYKGFNSIVLLAVVDATYSFVMVDIGAYGRQSDGDVLANSVFGKRLKAGTLDLPAPSAQPGSEQISPYVFVGDEAFPLKENMMRPYPGNNFKHGIQNILYDCQLFVLYEVLSAIRFSLI